MIVSFYPQISQILAYMNNYTPHPDYDKLPESIKVLYTEKEHAWLTNDTRQRLIEDHCYPEDVEYDHGS